ncbi:MAG: hypothetical protein U0586_12120 [Candidatus Brocadiaceae bacterium]
MINLDLTKDEKDILIGILENDLSDLRMEIADTDNMDFRETLKKQKAVLQKTLETLRQAKDI